MDNLPLTFISESRFRLCYKSRDTSKKRAAFWKAAERRRRAAGCDGVIGETDDATGPDDGPDAAAASGDQAVADAKRRIERLHRERTGEQPAAGAGRGARKRSPNDAHEGEPAAPAAEAPVEPGDWASETLETDAGGLAANLGTELDNAFDSDRPAPARRPPPSDGLSVEFLAGVGGGGGSIPATGRTSKPMSPRRCRCANISNGRPPFSSTSRRRG